MTISDSNHEVRHGERDRENRENNNTKKCWISLADEERESQETRKIK